MDEQHLGMDSANHAPDKPSSPRSGNRNRGRTRRKGNGGYRQSAGGNDHDRDNLHERDGAAAEREFNEPAQEETEFVPEPLPEGVEISRELSEIRAQSIEDLHELCQKLELNVGRSRKVDLVYAIARRLARSGSDVYCEGVLDIVHQEKNYGFLRSREFSYISSQDDIFVSAQQINKLRLRVGDTIRGTVRSPSKGSERYFTLNTVDEVNGDAPGASRRKAVFENLTPLFPDEALILEQGTGSSEDIMARTIDLIAPIGRGQRGLIVSPPKAGKTLLLQSIAHSISRNYEDVELIVLLIDERPEEVTEMARSVRGEVVASTFDEPASRHVQVANIVIEKAKRMVENRKNVVILLDSITRLARAYNTVQPSSGRVLTGGVDANALERPKRFFGAARNIEEGGSLTIIATALVDTGSKMDEVIYEEFKGTGNMEVHLDRRIAEKRIFPAINIRRSGTRREDLIMDEDSLSRVWILRRLLHEMDDLPAMEFLRGKLKQVDSNEKFFETMKRK